MGTVVKALRDLTVEDLERYPIWRYMGESDCTATVSPVDTFERPDAEAYIARDSVRAAGRRQRMVGLLLAH